MHHLRDVLKQRAAISAHPEASVHEVALMMTKGRIGAVPIVDGGRLVGIFSERDLVSRVFVPRLDPDGTRVCEVMTGEVATATPDDDVDACVQRMKSVGCRHLPVLEDGRLVGVVSMRDLLRDEIAEQHLEIRTLRAYIHQTPL